jgi:hypothetical protein
MYACITFAFDHFFSFHIYSQHRLKRFAFDSNAAFTASSILPHCRSILILLLILLLFSLSPLTPHNTYSRFISLKSSIPPPPPHLPPLVCTCLRAPCVDSMASPFVVNKHHLYAIACVYVDLELHWGEDGCCWRAFRFPGLKVWCPSGPVWFSKY